MESMGDRIRRLRQARDMSQEELGRLCGVSGAAVNQWESGATKSIRLPTVLMLMDALKTDLAYLVHGPERRPVDQGSHARNGGTGKP
jgi:transcriptional regulator with XRE-family HTH domain